MASYLALPRPGDVGKAAILPLAFACGAVLTSSTPNAHTVVRTLLVWFALEYLAYQARYQWNDIRGFWSDQLHPDRDTRGRLPGPSELGRQHITISAAIAATRVLAALLLVALVPGLHLAAVLIPSVVAVFAVAALYERVRSRAGDCEPGPRPAVACVTLWLVSGGGYCVRGLTGLALAAGPAIPVLGLALAGAACWFAGIVFVTTRWSVESLPFVTRRAGRLQWAAKPGSGRGHLLALAHWLPDDAEAAPRELRHWRLLQVRRPWHAPWNIALLLALVAAWLSGAAFQLSPAGAVLPLTASVVLAGSVPTLVGWLLMMSRPGAPTAAIAAAVFAVSAVLEWTTPAPSVLCVVVCAVYATCTRQCLNDVGTLYQRRIRPYVAAVAHAVAAHPLPSGPLKPATMVERSLRS